MEIGFKIPVYNTKPVADYHEGGKTITPSSDVTSIEVAATGIFKGSLLGYIQGENHAGVFYPSELIRVGTLTITKLK